MHERDRLFAEADESTPSEPFTVREQAVLSPCARERPAGGEVTDADLIQRRGTSIDGLRRIRWGGIHEFKGLEAPAVILNDVDLSNGYRSDLLDVGASRDRPACCTGARTGNRAPTAGPVILCPYLGRTIAGY
jgi:hypothetical protein